MFIELKDVWKTYTTDHAPLPVLKGINLSIEEGESVVLLGASGTGKSTLLHIMGSLDSPTQGDVIVDGKNLNSMNDRETSLFRNQTVGFVFQFHHLLPDFDARENVAMPLLIAGESKKSALIKADGLLEKVGLESRSRHQPQQLSGGEQQRVAIARALICSPKLLLADEPTGNLDGDAGAKVFDLLLDLNRELRVTLVVVTHNETLSGRFSRVIRLIDGKNQNSN